MFKFIRLYLFLFGGAITLISAPVFGFSKNVDLHGFSEWIYGKTDGNPHQAGNKDGNYEHSMLSLNIFAKPYDKLTISTQVEWANDMDTTSVQYDYAFAELYLTDTFKLRIGKVKHPFGIYGEVLNVGTIRPFLYLPLGIYGKQGFIAEGYNGVGITGAFYFNHGWDITYDLYGGLLKSKVAFPSLLMYGFSPEEAYLSDDVILANTDISDMIGGRLIVNTPLTGLSIGSSAYMGKEELDNGGLFRGDHTTYGCQIEYLLDNLWIRSEYAYHEIEDRMESDGAYAEIAYMFRDHFQLAVQFDYSNSDFESIDIDKYPSFVKETLEHEGVAFGFNYWFNQNFVIKMSYHMVTGIRFAFPEFDDALDFILKDEFDRKTRLFQIGAQFSF